MRVSFSSLLCVMVVALSLANANHGIDIEGSSTTSLSFSTLAATTATYKTFIHQLRQKLSVGTDRVHDVAVLNQTVQDNSKRFISIDLTNSFNVAITLAIDVVDVKVVAYLTNGKSYFFPDAPNSASQSLFSNSEKQVLNFSSSFQSIELASGTTRLTTPLGLTPLSSAIDNLFHYRREIVPSSFLVIIQMISEASKFKFIEQSVRISIRDSKEFTPGLAIVSLEDNWSTLSAYIQTSLNLQGLFPNTIQLYNSKDEPIIVDSIYYPIIFSNIALQLYRCPSNGNDPIPKLIRMIDVDDDNNNNDDDPCQVQERRTWISGVHGYCLSEFNTDGIHIVMLRCRGYEWQQWTFRRDGTIQCEGKCLSNLAPYSPNAVLFDCDLAGPESTTWKLYNDGTISNPSSNLYLDSERVPVSIVPKRNTSYQVWRVGNNVDPIVSSIIGFKDMCLEAIESSNYEQLWMENCVKDKRDQEWALFNDGTIRVNRRRDLCVSTNSSSSGDVIKNRVCDGSPNQSWIFKADGSIFNPVSGYVMDVKSKNVNLHQIILYTFRDNNNQKWIPFY